MSNRIGRLEFFFWCCVSLVVGSLVLSIVSLVIGGPDIVDVRPPARGLFGLMILVISMVILRAEVSRFHDLGWSGWNVLFALAR
jgi:uncharacterized membrane protein YhaH (DUF805 family)